MSKLPTNTQQQLARLLAFLRAHHSINTYDARLKLDIYHPPAQIKQLRALSHNIKTHWETIDTGLGKHRIARYVLLAGDNQ